MAICDTPRIEPCHDTALLAYAPLAHTARLLRIFRGVRSDYFIFKRVAIDGGLNFTAILPSSVKIYDSAEGIQTSLNHRLYMFSPDIHVSFAFGHVSIDSEDE